MSFSLDLTQHKCLTLATGFIIVSLIVMLNIECFALDIRFMLKFYSTGSGILKNPFWKTNAEVRKYSSEQNFNFKEIDALSVNAQRCKSRWNWKSSCSKLVLVCKNKSSPSG